jgi:hypothetical protein
MTSIPNRFRLPLSATIEQLERDGFERLIDAVNTAPEEECEPGEECALRARLWEQLLGPNILVQRFAPSTRFDPSKGRSIGSLFCVEDAGR